MDNLLCKINKPNDIKQIDPKEYKTLAKEIRRFLVNSVSQNGGHLASNLGVVELTMALHIALDLPEDKIVWDVGHQAYTHKILTGRKSDFSTLRKYNGLSGFPKSAESDCDSFNTGHSSTSLSVALGLATANKLNDVDSTVVAVIGDGAMTGGLAFEALNNVSALKRNFIIILNDNNMSISENVGGMSEYFNKIRVGEKYNDFKGDVEKSLNKIPKIGGSLVKTVKNTKDVLKQLVVPGSIFDDLGITYIGPVDGHDIDEMVKIIKSAKKLDHPVLIHTFTKKGYGYKYAVKNPQKYHGVEPFDKKTGEILAKSKPKTYTDIFSEKICEIASEDKDIIAITAAMPDGTGLSKFKELYPDRFFDVGIAEEHAVTFAAGLAKAGKKPYVAIYSSFYQRAYDQIIHDVCLSNLPVRLMIDRAGLVGRDGETHQGVFDISFLSAIPNLTIISPTNDKELEAAIEFSKDFDKPLAIRYSRGKAYTEDFDGSHEFTSVVNGKTHYNSRILIDGDEVALIAVGNIVECAAEAVMLLRETGISAKLIDARFVKPVDYDMVNNLANKFKYIFTLEEGIKRGGYGENVNSILTDNNYKGLFRSIAIDDMFVPQGSVAHLRKKLGLDSRQIADFIISNIRNGN